MPLLSGDSACRRSCCFGPFFPIAITASMFVGPLLLPCMSAERASSIVQSALRSEITADLDERARLLDEALRLDPKSSEAHWARGEVLVHGQWRSLESAAAEANDRDSLEKYREQRDHEDNTIQGQVRMADYCRNHRLPAQERAHWMAVVALAPNHPVARQRLGQTNIDGAWIDARQLDEYRKADQAASKYMLKHGKELFRLSNALESKTLSPAQVVNQLGEFRSPQVIPGLEYFFSSRGEEGGLCTVETLASLSAPEASLSLVRHALDFSVESVRVAATNSLKQRDEHSFIPALLSALQTPVQKQDEFALAPGNLLIWRRSISVENQETKKIATLDRAIQLSEAFPTSGGISSNWTQRAMLAGDLQLVELNRQIDLKNDQLMDLLGAVTNADSKSNGKSASTKETKTSPQDWWNRWSDRIESYPSDQKQVQIRYEKAFVPPTVTETQSTPRHECLAAGTPIWTETGPVAVDQIHTGDLVLTQNLRTGELKFAPVLSTSNRPPELLLRLRFGRETIRATGGHPFWVSGKGWIKARSLEPGMALHTAHGIVELDSVDEEREASKAYNLIVDECHSYFVGEKLILSHDNSRREPVANPVPGLQDEIDLTRSKQ